MAKRWYIVHAYSNFEKKVAESIKEQSVQKGLGDLFEQVLVPTLRAGDIVLLDNLSSHKRVAAVRAIRFAYGHFAIRTHPRARVCRT